MDRQPPQARSRSPRRAACAAASTSSAGSSTTSSAPTASIGTSRARSISAAPCGVEANADFAAIRPRVQKMADIGPAFEATARRREAKARAAEEAGQTVTARDNYFMAAIHWGAAQWPYDENDETNIAYNQKKRDCYAHLRAARRPQRRGGVDPVQGQRAARPGSTCRPDYTRRQAAGGDRHPRHGQLQGSVGRALWRPLAQSRHRRAGDRRAGPVRGADGRHQRQHGELDRRRQAGVSTGSPRAPRSMPTASASPARASARSSARIVAANEPRIRACAVISTCLEPGCHTIFEEASPTFKKRFMYMSGYHRRGEVRRILQDADLGRPCRARSHAPISASPARPRS